MTNSQNKKKFVANFLEPKLHGLSSYAHGEKVTIWATSLKEANDLLEEEYGKGNIFDLHDPVEAEKPR